MGLTGGISVRRGALVVVTALMSSFLVLGAPAAANASGEGTILALVNQARAANNLGPLSLNSSMSAVSAAWANKMAANGAMTHNPNYASQIPGGWSSAAENVAKGYPSPTAVHNGWMGSSGHRANILGDYTDIGIAFITSGGTTWAVENFAKYGSSVPPPAPPAPPAPAPPPPPPADPPAFSSPPSVPGNSTGDQGSGGSAGDHSATDNADAQGDPESEQSVRTSPTATPSAPARAEADSPRATARTGQDAAPTGVDGAIVPPLVGGLLALAAASAGAWTILLLRRRWRKVTER